MGDAIEDLRGLIARYMAELAPVPWPSEHARWHEMVYCLADSYIDDPPRTRQLMGVLTELRLIDVEDAARRRSSAASSLLANA